VHLVAPANEAADVELARNPRGMPVAKDDVSAVHAVVVAGIREVFVWPIGTRGIIGILDYPDVGDAAVLADEVLDSQRQPHGLS